MRTPLRWIVGDSCTTKWLYLTPEHCVPKNGQNGIFYIMYILLQASKQDYVLTKKKRTSRFLLREVQPRKWYPACGRWCFHQPLQARKLLPAVQEPMTTAIWNPHRETYAGQLEQWITQSLDLQFHRQYQGMLLACPSAVFAFSFLVFGDFLSALCGLQDLQFLNSGLNQVMAEKLGILTTRQTRNSRVSFLKWSSLELFPNFCIKTFWRA